MKPKMLVATSLWLAAILSTPVQASDSDFACVTPVQSFSNLAHLKKGDFSANVKWQQVKLSANSIGYGPGEDHRYELTIADGKVYMARPATNGGVIIRHDPKPEEGAAMLQVASPKVWAQQGELPAINSFDDLNFELDNVVDDIGCDDSVLLPFKIKGHAQSVTWSMDTKPARVTTTRNQHVEIVGLYNRNNKSKYFMVRGYNIHPHVVMQETGYAGHLRSVTLDDGAKLFLPKK